MTEIRFYHLQKQTLDQALPLIVEKAFNAGHKITIRLSTPQEVDRMNNILWSYKPNSFLPHGSKKNNSSEKQPIWLTDKEENLNNSNVLILTQDLEEENIDAYDLCCELLEDKDKSALEAARKRWKIYLEHGHDVTYWHQSSSGSWQKKK